MRKHCTAATTAAFGRDGRVSGRFNRKTIRNAGVTVTVVLGLTVTSSVTGRTATAPPSATVRTPTAHTVPIELPTAGTVTTQVLSKDAGDTLGYQLSSPRQSVVCSDCTAGASERLGAFPRSTSLLFVLTDSNGAGTVLFSSNNPHHARVTHPERWSWMIHWDDSGGCIPRGCPDGDFNDLVTSILLTRFASIDVQPGSATNVVRLTGGSVVPVAILSTAAFDASTASVTTICFGSADHPRKRECLQSQSDLRVTDVNGDGLPDALLVFDTDRTGIRPGDTSACLTGQTTAGEPFRGCDTIHTISVPPIQRPPAS